MSPKDVKIHSEAERRRQNGCLESLGWVSEAGYERVGDKTCRRALDAASAAIRNTSSHARRVQRHAGPFVQKPVECSVSERYRRFGRTFEWCGTHTIGRMVERTQENWRMRTGPRCCGRQDDRPPNPLSSTEFEIARVPLSFARKAPVSLRSLQRASEEKKTIALRRDGRCDTSIHVHHVLAWIREIARQHGLSIADTEHSEQFCDFLPGITASVQVYYSIKKRVCSVWQATNGVLERL